MSALRGKSSVTLIVAILVLVLLVPLWYTVLAPWILLSQLEQIDLETSNVGTFGKKGYAGTYAAINRSGVWEIPITITAHAYVTKVEEENFVLRVDMTMTREDTGETLPAPYSVNLTYMFNKFTMENVKDSPEADKPREGHDPLYPPHLKAGEDIPNVWLESLDTTATLQFSESVVEQGVTLYKYFVNETTTELRWIEELGVSRNCTLTSTRTILLEPLSGLLAYIENETFNWITTYRTTQLPFVYLTYRSSTEAKNEGLALARTAHDGLQLMELYIPTIFGVAVIILVIAFILNLRRLKKKKPLG